MTAHKNHLRNNLLAIAFGSVILFYANAANANNDFDSGMQFIQTKEYDRALACLDRSVDSEPTNASFHYWRGKLLDILEKSREACAEFKLAAMLTDDPKVKEDCGKELARFNMELPKGSVNEALPGEKKIAAAAQNLAKKRGSATGQETSEDDKYGTTGEKLFKLSSKKLDWNLQLGNDFLQAMKNRTDGLDSLENGANKRQMQIQSRRGVPARVPARMASLAAAFNDGPAHVEIPLSVEEKKVLSASDVVLVLDHSSSMGRPDCPSAAGTPEARISWCAEELESFADKLSSAFPNGFHFVTFDSRPDTYAINNAEQLRKVLQSLSFGGGTDLSAALNEAIRIHQAHPSKPLLIAVITDAEISVKSCEQTIINATRQFPLPNGIFITMIQVGMAAEPNSQNTFSMLENLDSRGAAYNAFFGIPFSRVRREGLGRDLLEGLRQNVNPIAHQNVTNKSAKATAPSSPSRIPASQKKVESSITLTKTSPSKPKLDTGSNASNPNMPLMWPANAH